MAQVPSPSPTLPLVAAASHGPPTYGSTIETARRTIDEHFQQIIDAATKARATLLDQLNIHHNHHHHGAHGDDDPTAPTNSTTRAPMSSFDMKAVATVELSSSNLVSAINGSCRVAHWRHVPEPSLPLSPPIVVTRKYTQIILLC
jgi:hypothetical protein